jgi:ketosteroid isomerase-like protein
MKHMIVTVFLTLAASAIVFGQCSDADKKALEALDRAWSVAGQNGDKAALTALYADDYVGLPAMLGKAATIDDTMRTFERNKTNPPTSTTTYDHYLIACTPTSATVTHRNTTVSPSGNTVYSRSVHILEKRGGKWQVVSNAGNALDDASIIWYLEQDWNDAVLVKNKSWFEKNYASDFTSISSTTGTLA